MIIIAAKSITPPPHFYKKILQGANLGQCHTMCGH